jgi:hypothetical protein
MVNQGHDPPLHKFVKMEEFDVGNDLLWRIKKSLYFHIQVFDDGTKK